MGVEFMKKKEEKRKAHKNNDDNNNANSQPHLNGVFSFDYIKSSTKADCISDSW